MVRGELVSRGSESGAWVAAYYESQSGPNRRLLRFGLGGVDITGQRFLEDHQVLFTVAVPSNSNDGVAAGDGHMEHCPVLILAFESHPLIIVVVNPGVRCIHKLAGDAHPAAIGKHANQPGEEGIRL